MAAFGMMPERQQRIAFWVEPAQSTAGTQKPGGGCGTLSREALPKPNPEGSCVHELPKMCFTPDDHMIDVFTADRPDRAFDVSICHRMSFSSAIPAW